uniref:Uncharacterized protein n=1 Tax=Arundo donax TaxID=35708 RepID=A0A0A9H5V9_ARUDO
MSFCRVFKDDPLLAALDVKLNDQNYHAWAVTIRKLLRFNGLASNFTPDEVDAKAAADWLLSDCRVMDIVYKCRGIDQGEHMSLIS